MDEKKVRRKGSLFSFGKLFKLILLLLVAAIAVDIYKNKGYKGTLNFISLLSVYSNIFSLQSWLALIFIFFIFFCWCGIPTFQLFFSFILVVYHLQNVPRKIMLESKWNRSI